MSQKLLYLMVPDAELAALESELQAAGYEVRPAQRAIPGIYVRIRVETADEGEVEQIARKVAPGHRFGPSGTTVADIADYRNGR